MCLFVVCFLVVLVCLVWVEWFVRFLYIFFDFYFLVECVFDVLYGVCYCVYSFGYVFDIF